MSLNSAINAALSGLSMASRATLTISSNVANATTDGYARRELETVGRDGTGGIPGVRIVTETRIVDQGLLGERRRSDAGMAEASARSAALATLEGAFGVPGQPGALASRVADFSAALIEASSRPDSLSRLDTVLRAARGLADDIAALGRNVQDGRSQADAAIDAAVAQLNDGLVEVDRLNRLIQRETAAGQVPNGLKDLRQQVIDSLAELVPLREVARPGGQVMLYTDNGAVLLDGRPARIGFDGIGGPLEPGMALAEGTLSGLTLDGVELSTGPRGLLSGGRIEGLFAVRDSILPAAQDDLDRLASDLVTRFREADGDAPVPLDPPGGGLFVDADPTMTPAEPGLAQRLRINPLADPAEPGGAVWRLRTGLGGTEPGFPGDATGVAALARGLESLGPLAGSDGPGRDVAGHAAELASRIGRGRDAAEGQLAGMAARNTALREAEAGSGVDTDTEMQRLLVIERLYAANARVLTAADEMIQRLLAI